MKKSSDRVKFLRRKTGLSLASFCEKVGIPFGTASNWENTDRKLREQTADKIIFIYKKLEIYVDKIWLMTGEGRLPKTFEELQERLANHNTSPYEDALFFQRSSDNREILMLDDLSMSPLYVTHDILGGDKIPQPDWKFVFGKPCLIKLSSHKLLCRLLYPSEASSKYHLVATNGEIQSPILSDQVIDSIFKIVFIRKSA